MENSSIITVLITPALFGMIYSDKHQDELLIGSAVEELLSVVVLFAMGYAV